MVSLNVSQKEWIFLIIFTICTIIGCIGLTSLLFRTRGETEGLFLGPTTLFEAITISFLIIGLLLMLNFVLIHGYYTKRELEKIEKHHFNILILVDLGTFYISISMLFVMWNSYLFEPFRILIFITVYIGLGFIISGIILMVIFKIPMRGGSRPDYPKTKVNFKNLDKKKDE